jgi:hypothetical protein
MNDQITNEKQNIEIICQDRLNENAAQVFSETTKKASWKIILINFRSDNSKRNARNMN